jgi:predicted TIM-barrel fold metal-dependent hydrolase
MIDCHNHLGVELGAYLRNEFPYGQQLPSLVAEGQPLGVERWIVFPMVTYLAMDLSAVRRGEVRLGGDLESVPYAFENRRMMEEIYHLYPEYSDLVYPFAILDPARKVAEQIEAIRELEKSYRFFGFKLQTTIIQSPVIALLEAGKPFLDLAKEWNLPMLIHSSVLPVDTWAQARDILEIAEKNPGVRFCLAHSCRFDRECLDRVAELPNTWFDCSAHRIHCQLATEDNPIVAPAEKRFATDYSNPAKALLDLARAYPEKLLWGSDSPYYCFVAKYENEFYSLKSTYSEEVACLMDLPDDLRSMVGMENTEKFLGARK